MQDDLLDTYGDVKVFGKISGGDIVASKKTFLYVKAMEIASSGQRKKLQKEYLDEEIDPESKVKVVTEIYDQLNIRSITIILQVIISNQPLSFLKKQTCRPKGKMN
jgi:geranylgeranyl diphosphate synthase type II